MGEEESGYFGYEMPPGGAIFIGTEKSQIINTMTYYRQRGDQEPFDIPSEEKILSLVGDVNITCCLPLANVNHNIDARVRHHAVFHVNANAFDYIQQIALNYEKLKRGDLYKFVAGAPIFGLWFLPEDIMQGLRDYNWSQHNSQIKNWLVERENALAEAEKRGHIIRAEPPLFGLN